MEFQDINENTIKIKLTFQDLEEHNVKLSDFFGNQMAVEQLFYELVEELELGDRFTSGVLTFQVQPHSKGIYLMVSEEKVDFDGDNDDLEEMMQDIFGKLDEKLGGNMMDRMENTNRQKEQETKQEEADFIYYSVKFDNISQLLDAVRNVQFKEEESELYRYDDKFYLVVLDNQRDKGSDEVAMNRARLYEYGKSTEDSREILQEYGEWLIYNNAMNQLAKI